MTIQPSVLIWTIICVSLLMLILNKLIFKPLLSIMDARRKKVEDASAEKARLKQERADEIRALEEEQQRLLAAAHSPEAIAPAVEKAASDEQSKAAEFAEKLTAEQQRLLREREEACAAGKQSMEELAAVFAEKLAGGKGE